MKREELHSSSGYGKPPWVFKGSALYQLHLVKAETARAFIPKDFRLVEAFGYTLGGFFLASYDDSPAGIFDELVVIAGIVWNPPTSCAWAARVLVNSNEACDHGRKNVGLPSQIARFSKVGFELGDFLDMVGVFASDSSRSCMDVQVSEIKGQAEMSICSINFNSANSSVPEVASSKWMGPPIKMSLPSFSGRTKYNPLLLKYSCQIDCRVRAVPPARVSGSHAADLHEKSSSECENSGFDFKTEQFEKTKRSLSMSVMLSKPILALQFNCLKMKVEAPTIISKHLQEPRRY